MIFNKIVEQSVNSVMDVLWRKTNLFFMLWNRDGFSITKGGVMLTECHGLILNARPRHRILASLGVTSVNENTGFGIMYLEIRE